MKQIIRSNDRGHAEHGWLKSFHSFSFADYYNPRMMGFRKLRVINEDWVDGGNGFPTHPHRDMEIITYMIEGTLEHRDTMGHRAQIKPGEVQRMSAGRGVQHSEMNPNRDETAHLLQIWIEPDVESIEPEYEQRDFSKLTADKSLVLAASKDGREDSMKIHQDADLWLGNLKADGELTFKPRKDVWVQLVKGSLKIGSDVLKPGDALVSQGEKQLDFSAEEKSEFLIFDL